MSKLASGMSVDFTNTVFLKSSSVFVNVNRLNWRAEVLIARNPGAIAGKRILDLASHDGRFTYAALTCGAKHVVGVEGRRKHVECAYQNLRSLGCPESRYEFIVGDLVDFLRSVKISEFDTILCLGVFSHLIEQVEILREIRRISPEHFILDGWVAKEKWNLVEKLRNHRVNTFVGVTQQGRKPQRRTLRGLFRLLRELTTSDAHRTGTLVFLYEDSKAEGATIRANGLMAWATRSLVDILFDYYGFDHKLINWREQGISDWTSLYDYRRRDRETWIARLQHPVGDAPSK
jgi:16S rRNA G966 N2-methylase RsmD